MIVVDASVWVSYLVPADVHHQISVRWLRQWRDEGRGLIAPILLLAEVAGAVSRRYGDPSLGYLAKGTIQGLPHLRLIDIDQGRGELSANLASGLRLRGADATYVALAQESGVPLVTWDDEVIRRASSAISVFAPELPRN